MRPQPRRRDAGPGRRRVARCSPDQPRRRGRETERIRRAPTARPGCTQTNSRGCGRAGSPPRPRRRSVAPQNDRRCSGRRIRSAPAQASARAGRPPRRAAPPPGRRTPPAPRSPSVSDARRHRHHCVARPPLAARERTPHSHVRRAGRCTHPDRRALAPVAPQTSTGAPASAIARKIETMPMSARSCPRP